MTALDSASVMQSSAGSGVDERFDFPNEEVKILSYWDSIDAFQRSIQLSIEAKRPIYTFYDGPPFATGLPHYGHILAGTIKDIILRYAHQKGFYVERKFGWDCHGLPVEHEIDKKLGITCREDVLKLGIDKYNEECRSIVTRYVNDWESIVKRSGRWIDFKDDVKTMYPSFMESVWWAFKELYDKNLVYKGYKVMPYSTACTSPLSNFEANLNYKETIDPSVVVSFSLRNDPSCSLLIWTTTPWTLTSNLAIICHPDLDYVKIKDLETGRIFILAETCLSMLYKNPETPGQFELLEKKKGSDLVGIKYVPLFDFFEDRAESMGNFVIISDPFVTSETGTGLVHSAPGFGEDDQRVALNWGIIKPDESIPCPVDEIGRFTAAVPPFQGMYFKDVDKEIMKILKSRGHLIKQSQVSHNYPFCWRSDTPLIYKAVPSWFVRVKGHNDALLENNAKTYWVPDHVREKKFANWLASAHDWAVSRNRYWGTPIPVWMSQDGEEMVVIGSIKELEEKTGSGPIKDIHRHFIDDLTIPSSRPGCPPLRRIDEVFDCWFESGSVPYASRHYPFENKDVFERHFPADFIGEGIDQTRGWFYTLMVLSTHLFNQPPFKNLIVNGLVLAADGKKMSKRLKNYPEPTLVMNSYGADALRLYLINSPVVCAEFLRFKEEGVKGILRDVFIPWVNVVKFFTEQAALFEKEEGKPFRVEFHLDESTDKKRKGHHLFKPHNKMDHWILACFHSVIQFVRQELDAYRLYTVLPRLLGFIDNLCNWYVRLNRQRLKGSLAYDERKESLTTLFHILFDLSRLMAPIVPFLSENMYLKLKPYLAHKLAVADDRSVHFLLIPQVEVAYLDQAIERAVSRVLSVIEIGRTLRESQNLSLRVPLLDVVVLTEDDQVRSDLESLKEYILGELNIRSLIIKNDMSTYPIEYRVTPNFAILGKKLGKDLSKVQAGLKNVSEEKLKSYLSDGQPLVVEGHKLEGDEINVSKKLAKDPEGYVSAMNAEMIVLLNTVVSDDLEAEGLAREVINRVQKLRKRSGLKASDEVGMFYRVTKMDPKKKLWTALESQRSFISKTLRQELVSLRDIDNRPSEILGEEEVELADGVISLLLANQLHINGNCTV